MILSWFIIVLLSLIRFLVLVFNNFALCDMGMVAMSVTSSMLRFAALASMMWLAFVMRFWSWTRCIMPSGNCRALVYYTTIDQIALFPSTLRDSFSGVVCHL